MRDEVDLEVTKLFRDMEQEVHTANMRAKSEDSIAHAVLEIGDMRAKARDRVQSVVALLQSHYDSLKDFPDYQKIVATMAGLDMILTSGFELALRIETEKLGHALTLAEMRGMLIKILCDLNDLE